MESREVLIERVDTTLNASITELFQHLHLIIDLDHPQ